MHVVGEDGASVGGARAGDDPGVGAVGRIGRGNEREGVVIRLDRLAIAQVDDFGPGDRRGLVRFFA